MGWWNDHAWGVWKDLTRYIGWDDRNLSERVANQLLRAVLQCSCFDSISYGSHFALSWFWTGVARSRPSLLALKPTPKDSYQCYFLERHSSGNGRHLPYKPWWMGCSRGADPQDFPWVSVRSMAWHPKVSWRHLTCWLVFGWNQSGFDHILHGVQRTMQRETFAPSYQELVRLNTTHETRTKFHMFSCAWIDFGHIMSFIAT